MLLHGANTKAIETNKPLCRINQNTIGDKVSQCIRERRNGCVSNIH